MVVVDVIFLFLLRDGVEVYHLFVSFESARSAAKIFSVYHFLGFSNSNKDNKRKNRGKKKRNYHNFSGWKPQNYTIRLHRWASPYPTRRHNSGVLRWINFTIRLNPIFFFTPDPAQMDLTSRCSDLQTSRLAPLPVTLQSKFADVFWRLQGFI